MVHSISPVANLNNTTSAMLSADECAFKTVQATKAFVALLVQYDVYRAT